jgi:hypothetical protein
VIIIYQQSAVSVKRKKKQASATHLRLSHLPSSFRVQRVTQKGREREISSKRIGEDREKKARMESNKVVVCDNGTGVRRPPHDPPSRGCSIPRSASPDQLLAIALVRFLE